MCNNKRIMLIIETHANCTPIDTNHYLFFDHVSDCIIICLIFISLLANGVGLGQ